MRGADAVTTARVDGVSGIDSLKSLPAARRQAGLLATLNTDDPAMSDLDLGREYRSVAQAQDMPWEEVTAVALDGIEASWLSDDEKRDMRATFEAEIAAIPVPA